MIIWALNVLAVVFLIWVAWWVGMFGLAILCAVWDAIFGK